jgi:hypothetical protein
MSARVFAMSLPDPETIAFWRATEDYPGEAAERIASFSRRMAGRDPGNSTDAARRHTLSPKPAVRPGLFLVSPGR